MNCVDFKSSRLDFNMSLQHSSVILLAFIGFQYFCKLGLCETCYTIHHNDTWNLVWQDNFDVLNDTTWNIEHEVESCWGNGIKQVSCNSNQTENVKVVNGHLVLSTFYHPNRSYDKYTAATLTTREYFGYGRYEIRAAIPIGKFLRSTIFTRNEHELYWHENGQIDIMSNTQEPVLHRGLHFADSGNLYSNKDLRFSKTKSFEFLNEFHLYGVEWDASGLKFFYDDMYSAPILFNNKTFIRENQQIRLQIGVGGRFFIEKFPDEFYELEWKCPSFIIDYVRIFEKSFNESSECTPYQWDIPRNSTLNQHLCSNVDYEVGVFATFKFHNGYLIIIIASAIFVLILFTSVFLYMQIIKIKRKVEDPYGINTYKDDETYENINYDYAGVDYSDKPSYDSSYRAQNEYLEIQNNQGDALVTFTTNSQPTTDNDYLPLKPSKDEIGLEYDNVNIFREKDTILEENQYVTPGANKDDEYITLAPNK